MATARVLGASIKRREDPRFITGKGNYTDDLKLAGMTHAVFVRSPHANAKIRKIDTAKASKAPGVVAIFTGKDMAGVNSLPCGWLLPELKIPAHMPLASDAAHASATVSALLPNLPADQIREQMKARGFTLGGGYGKWKNTTFRIGHMGDITLDALNAMLDVLDEVAGS